MKRYILSSILLILFISIFGCGGGSSGTGTGNNTVTIRGVVTDDNQQPFPGVLVTVLEGGESDTTDSTGQFEINTDLVADEYTLEFAVDNKSVTTTISAVGGNGTISIEVQINPLLDDITVNDISVDARIVGTCDNYFENKDPIRQANNVPENGVQCTLKVTVKNKKIGLAHVPIAIQYRRCEGNKSWFTSELGATMSGANLGIAQIDFRYYSNDVHCRYRIVTPYYEDSGGIDRERSVIKYIDTFEYQGRTK